MPQIDAFGSVADQPFAPSREFYTVTPDDANDLPRVPKGVICSTTGNLVCLNGHGASVTIPVLGGLVYPISPSRIKSTGHTAGTVIALA